MLSKNASKGALPNLIIIGAMKCGTTSLHYYLNQHPEISMSSPKELKFFVAEKNWQRGVEWYRSHFSDSAKIRGEASPDYTACHRRQNVASRIYSVVPEAKLIYIIRDPVERIISHYMHRKLKGVEHRTINEALSECDLCNNNYLLRSQYYLQLKEYLNYFPNRQILILTLEELSSHPQKTLKKIFSYLEVEESFKNFQIDKKLNQAKNKIPKNSLKMFGDRMSLLNYAFLRLPNQLQWQVARLLGNPFSLTTERPQLSPELKQRIIDLLQEDVNRLREYTGKDFHHWCV